MASPSSDRHIDHEQKFAFQSARQIIGFPKDDTRQRRPNCALCFNLQGRLLASPSIGFDLTSRDKLQFQSARQIIGFPKSSRSPAQARASRFNLQGRLLASPRARKSATVPSSTSCFNLQGRLLASPRRRCDQRQRGNDRVSICKADYWLPQASYAPVGAITAGNMFQSARQIIGFPKGMGIGSKDQEQVFQSARQIIGFPKDDPQRHDCVKVQVSICKADYWLPQVSRARVERTTTAVSICKADYWLPQDQRRQKAAIKATGFNLQGRLLASPSCVIYARPLQTLRFQSARQIIGFPKQHILQQRADSCHGFNLQGRLLASPSSI